MNDLRTNIRTKLNNLISSNNNDFNQIANELFNEDTIFDVAFPINNLKGKNQILSKFYIPLRKSFKNIKRRDDIFIGGNSTVGNKGFWVASTTHYVGQFIKPFCNVYPQKQTHQLFFFRSGEFYYIKDNKILNAKILFDLPNLMLQNGVNPFFNSYGSEILFPSPASQDGICPNSSGGSTNLKIVEKMLRDLMKFNPKDYSSVGQTGIDGAWSDDMLWYGPTGIGSNFRWDGFVSYHRKPFLDAFPDRLGGNHYCHIGDGNYAATSGWPSMTMTFKKEYLGIKPSNQKHTLRVMDFYRLSENKIVENWVYLDLLDFKNQVDK